MNSLDEDLQRSLTHEVHKKTCTFTVMYLSIMHIIKRRHRARCPPVEPSRCKPKDFEFETIQSWITHD